MAGNKKTTQLINDETLSNNRSLYKNIEGIKEALNQRIQKELHGVRSKNSSKEVTTHEKAAG